MYISSQWNEILIHLILDILEI